MIHAQDWPYCKSRWELAVKHGEPYESQQRMRRAVLSLAGRQGESAYNLRP